MHGRGRRFCGRGGYGEAPEAGKRKCLMQGDPHGGSTKRKYQRRQHEAVFDICSPAQVCECGILLQRQGVCFKMHPAFERQKKQVNLNADTEQAGCDFFTETKEKLLFSFPVPLKVHQHMPYQHS